MINGIPNLQLLDYNQNRGEKSDISLYDWIIASNTVRYDPYSNETDKEIYKIKTKEQFADFYNKRRKLIIDHLCAVFNCK